MLLPRLPQLLLLQEVAACACVGVGRVGKGIQIGSGSAAPTDHPRHQAAGSGRAPLGRRCFPIPPTEAILLLLPSLLGARTLEGSHAASGSHLQDAGRPSSGPTCLTEEGLQGSSCGQDPMCWSCWMWSRHWITTEGR